MAFLYGVGGSGVRSVVGKNGYFHYMIKPVFIFANRRTFVQNFLRKVVGRNGNTVRNVGDLVVNARITRLSFFLSILSISKVF